MSDQNNENPGAQARATGAKSKRSKLTKKSSSKPEPTKALSRQHAWRQRNPLAAWAHDSFQSGLNRGLVERQPCVRCGKPQAEGHHEAYDRPLDVIWLCRPCHRALHAQRRAKS